MPVDAVRGVLFFILLASSLFNAKPLLASAVTYRQQGLLYRDRGRFPEAIDALQKAVELEPQNLSGRVSLGWTLHLAGEDRSAAEVLRQTAAIDPFNVPACNALGIVYLVNNDLPAAVFTHTWASWLAPDNEIPHYNLSLAFERLQHYDWAIVSAQKATRLEPDNPHPWVAQSIAHWGKGDKTAALQDYRRAIELDSRYGDLAFLDALTIAGFSSNQISTAKVIAASR